VHRGLSAEGEGAEKDEREWSEHPAFFHEQRVGAINKKSNALRDFTRRRQKLWMSAERVLSMAATWPPQD
jgi:hypothetical protein